MWLLGQILIYLILAFLIGGVGGWMLRGRRAQDDQAQLRERFKQMVSSIEMERDAARLKARDLGARLEELEGTRGAQPADDEEVLRGTLREHRPRRYRGAFRRGFGRP